MERNTGLHQDPSASASNIAFSEKRLRLYKSTVNMQITVKIVLKLGADGLKMESAGNKKSFCRKKYPEYPEPPSHL